jgi:hypothetical protein
VDWNGVAVIVSSSGRGRYGVTPFLVSPFIQEQERLSMISFYTFVKSDTYDYWHVEAESRGETWERRDFRLGDVTFPCWQHPAKYRPRLWEADCETPAALHEQFYAHFLGQEDDLRAFYQMIEGIRLLNFK